MARRNDSWWRDGASDPVQLITGHVSRILEQQSSRRDESELYLKLYNLGDVDGSEGTKTSSTLRVATDGRVRFNLLRAVAAPFRAHLGSITPRVKCQTSGATWSLIKKAHAFELAIASVFDDNALHDTVKQVFIDACTNPLGAVKVFDGGDGKVRLERVFPGEVLVDRDDGYYGAPRVMYQCKLYPKDVLYDIYPEKADIIDTASAGDARTAFGWLPGWSIGDDQAFVIEGWRLPRFDRETGEYVDGRHAIVLTSGALVEPEDYTLPTFPIVVYRWARRSFGFGGIPLAEDIRSAMETVRYYDLRIEDAMFNVSRIKVMAEEGAIIDTFNDDPADVYTYKRGQNPPTIHAPNVIPAELIQLRQQAIDEAYRQHGLNELIMQGQRPAGVNSGAAMRELQDQNSQRFKDKIQEIEKFYVDIASQVIATIIDMDQRGDLDPFKIKLNKGRRLDIKEINWKDIDFGTESYWLEMSPASSLPTSSAGRMQTINDWLQMGIIDVQEARELFQLPDLDAASSYALAAYYNTLDAIEDIVEDGVYNYPEPTDDLEFQHKRAIEAYNKYKRLGLEEEKLDLLLKLANDSLDLLTQAQAESQPQPMPQPTAPEAVPVAQ